MVERGPVIGVTGPDRGGGAAWICTALAVRRAAAVPVRISPAQPRDCSRLDALILGGGADVAPERYGQRPELRPRLRSRVSGLADKLVFLAANALRRLLERPSGGRVDPERDRLEFALLDQALRRAIPVLGLCRGAQLINVHLGGTLHQDLTSFYVEEPEVRSLLPRKLVRIEDGSRLLGIVQSGELRVNALHRQAVADLAPPLRVSARDRNGIVQAVEHPGMPFVIGVQWHPEYLPQLTVQQKIFRALAAACGARPEARTEPMQPAALQGLQRAAKR